MNKTTEALKLAEEALAGGLWDYGPGQDEHTKCEEALAAIREALAESYSETNENCSDLNMKQDPVGVVTSKAVDGVVQWTGWVPREGTKLYAAPVQPVKQEPVAIIKYFDIVPLQASQYLEPDTLLYATPEDVKAIRDELEITKRCLFQAQEAAKDARAEAFEEAAKVCERDLLGDNSRRDYERMNCAASIRSLK